MQCVTLRYMETSALRLLIGGRRYVYTYVQNKRTTSSTCKIIGRHMKTTRTHVWFLAPNGSIRRIRNGDMISVV